MNEAEALEVGLQEIIRRWEAARVDRNHYREALESIDQIPWDSPASAQMRTNAHFALEATMSKKSKRETFYRPKSHSSRQHCGNCVYMHNDGSCTKVQGLVDKEHICDLWTPERTAGQ